MWGIGVAYQDLVRDGSENLMWGAGDKDETARWGLELKPPGSRTLGLFSCSIPGFRRKPRLAPPQKAERGGPRWARGGAVAEPRRACAVRFAPHCSRPRHVCGGTLLGPLGTQRCRWCSCRELRDRGTSRHPLHWTRGHRPASRPRDVLLEHGLRLPVPRIQVL